MILSNPSVLGLYLLAFRNAPCLPFEIFLLARQMWIITILTSILKRDGTGKENVVSACTSLSVPFFQKHSTNDIDADTCGPNWNHLSSPLSISIRPEQHIVICQPAVAIVVFFFFFFNQTVNALRNFTVFCQNSKLISHRYTYIPSLLEHPHISHPIQ